MPLFVPTCPSCQFVSEFPAGIDMQGVTVLCDHCLEVTIYDNGVLRVPTQEELVVLMGTDTWDVIQRVRKARLG